MLYTPVPTPLPGQVTITADGEDRKAASVTVPESILLDAVAWLSKLVFEGYYHVPLHPVLNENTRFGFDSNIPCWQQDNITDQGGLWFYLAVPPGGRLMLVEALVDGNAGSGGGAHGGSPPATLPDVTVWRVEDTGGVAHTKTQVASQTDAGGAGYDNLHRITATLGTPETLGQNKAFLVRFRGEAGANSLANELALIDLRFRVEKTS